jgi:uncharacterized protein (DUF488 family)
MLTIGHSTLPIDTFLSILRENGVRTLADIRTVPQSRHSPQFGQKNLEASATVAGINYHWCGNLGGLRHARKDSINTGWRNASFRGYADYMQTAEFATALDELLKAAPHEHTALMCAEAVPWRWPPVAGGGCAYGARRGSGRHYLFVNRKKSGGTA